MAAATYALVIHWAVGVAAGVAVADTEHGLIRDHPLYGRRLSGRVVPVMAVLGLAVPLLLGASLGALPPTWIVISIPLMLPFAWLSWRWSRTWIGRHLAATRRRLGIWTVIAGLLGVIPSSLIAIHQMEPEWRSVIPLAIFAGGVALSGSLTNLSIMALTAGLPEEVPGGQIQGVAEVAGFGLLCSLLALIDVGVANLETGGQWPAHATTLAVGWALCLIAIPGAILLARARWKLPDAIFMPGALGLALAGQWMAYLLIFQYPGLIAPHMWE